MIKLGESELVAQLIENLSKKEKWGMTGLEWVKVYESFAKASYEYLNLVKDKNKRVALIFTDASDAHNFLLAAVIEYHKNGEGEDVGGNWSFEYTFDPQDTVGCDLKYSNDTQFLTVLNDCTRNSMKDANGIACGFMIDAEDSVLIFDAIIRYLIMWLDKNANDKEVIDLVLEDYFKASVAIEEGQKVMTLVPHGRSKSKIKNDDQVSEDATEEE